MSEEKLYAVKNDDGEWADSHYTFGPGAWATPDKSKREEDAKHHGGHVVALVKEPKKVVLTKEQAKIVEDAHMYMWPAKYIADNTDGGYESERLMMEAYVNGYIVAKEKKYNVKVPHTKDVWYFKASEGYLLTISDKKLRSEFTEAEIKQYSLQDCEKEEVTDNDD